jgi:hypothetical protein
VPQHPDLILRPLHGIDPVNEQILKEDQAMASKKFNLILACMIASIFVIVGCGSSNDNPAAPPYAQPPEAPTGLSVSFSPIDMTVTLTWDQSTSATHAGYLIQRGGETEGDRITLVNSPQLATHYIDDNDIDYGDKLYYYVYAVDTRNNQSAEALECIKIENPLVGHGPGLSIDP